MAINSTIRIFERRGHSDHAAAIYTTIDEEGRGYLYIYMANGCEMRLPAEDASEALRDIWAAENDKLLNMLAEEAVHED